MDADYRRYCRTLRRRPRRDVDPYRQYCMSLGSGLPLESVDLPVSWQLDDRRQHPWMSASGYQLTDSSRASSYTSEVSRCL